MSSSACSKPSPLGFTTCPLPAWCPRRFPARRWKPSSSGGCAWVWPASSSLGVLPTCSVVAAVREHAVVQEAAM